MRPQGEIRQVVLATIREHGPLPMRDVASVAQVSLADAKRTISRCLQARQLVVAGREKPANSKRWTQIYDIAPPPPPIEPRHGHGWVDLGRIVDGWAR